MKEKNIFKEISYEEAKLMFAKIQIVSEIPRELMFFSKNDAIGSLSTYK
jgi:hypothetical protein